MKGIKLLFAVLLAPLVFHAALADDASDIARAATRRGTTNTVSSNRQKSDISSLSPTAGRTQSASRTLPTASDNTPSTERSRATTADVVSRVPSATSKSVMSRPASGATVTRTATTPIRGTSNRAAASTRAATTPRTISRTTDKSVNRLSNRSRSAIQSRNATAAEIISRDTSKCRTVFYDCMDEFCAAKDAQLKRCACSSRAREFDATKQNLADVEDKLLDFSQRLLTVNMDAEDAAALNTPTAGELAFSDSDTSRSKQMLDEISKKLNTSFSNDTFDQGLNAISLSLNMDAAFDGLDSMAGASTTAKSGTALHAAALPVCRELAAEVCTPSELAIAEGGYQMLIAQDCNTVAKSYQTQIDMARSKVFEGSALLDMSRLDIYQKRNSDDILTCKRKMLDMLTDTTVCGSDMGKCLDTTGRYIDPTTGTAFLTTDLSNLATLITRPGANESWSTAPGNDRFVSYLNSKKKFLEPAMENCQDISDYVWDTFIEDALSQIKIAQDRKLEQVRQSCTTLTAQCLDETAESLANFDSRALSVFGVAADTTVNAMCSDVRNACTALLQSTGGGGADWETGVTGIMTDTTYATILSTCREVGKNCIVQACKSISGNFGLCENIDTSINRKTIINRTACWDQVVECVASAGPDSISRIMESMKRTADADSGDMYETLYGGTILRSNKTDDPATSTIATADAATDTNTTNVYDICAADDCAATGTCATCRLAEQIWGNCEYAPNTELSDDNATNKILTMTADDPNETLLSWFARNTGTADEPDSCRDTSCPAGYKPASDGSCISLDNFTGDGAQCTSADGKPITIYSSFTNCCPKNGGTVPTGLNFCTYGATATSLESATYGTGEITAYLPNSSSTTSAYAFVEIGETQEKTQYALVCTGKVTESAGTVTEGTETEPDQIQCDGEWLLISENGHHIAPLSDTYVTNYYNSQNGICTYKQSATDSTDSTDPTAPNVFTPGTDWGEGCNTPTNGWHIKYSNP